MNSTTLPAIITASAALIGAMAAQIFSHVFTVKRENRKSQMEVYQNFYVPIVYDIFAYIDSRIRFYGGDKKDNIDEESFKEKVISHISCNIKYAGPRVISKYNLVSKYKYTEDLSGFHKEAQELELMAAILHEYYKIANKNKILDKQNKKVILNYYVDYLFWCSSIYLTGSITQGSTIASYRWMFDKRKYTRLFVYYLDVLFNSKDWTRISIYFLKLLRNEKDKIFFKEQYEKSN